MPADRPNIILINCDDLGYGDLGCYGSAKNKTPYIDRLAAGGCRLTDFYMASPVCSASRAALLTGCYPQRVGFGPHAVLFPGDPVGLNPSETTIAAALKSAGYRTKIIGKWHCGDQPEFLPTRHGFDEYFGIPFSNDMGRQSNNPARPPLPLLRDETVIQEQPDQRGLTERYADAAVEFIHRKSDEPFFLYLAHMYVHVPLFVPKPFLEKSTNGAYGGAVECIDWCTGLILDRLEQDGLLDDTLIIFTSDNGSRVRGEGGSNGPCRGTKGTTWEGGQRVPCVIHWPGKIPAGSVCSDIARSMDLFPTLCRWAGVTDLPGVKRDGVDLSEVLSGKSRSGAANTFAYYLRESFDAIRSGDWKLHFSKEEKPVMELYNLRLDIGETDNAYDRRPDVVEELSRLADEIRDDLGDSLKQMSGSGIRPIGRTENARPLTHYREDYPYIVAMYDLPDMPTMSG